MVPTIDEHNNLIWLDAFTVCFLRSPRKNEIVIAENPFKPRMTVIKRVVGTEGDIVEFTDHHGLQHKVLVPKNHLWLQGDNAA
mmetsp:Transcript_16712/g.16009  ORF Transcript_16712/g.16009 Transcript_16712/m.16009 type:complete len:83 (+) Transcript_16712:159-407(+)